MSPPDEPPIEESGVPASQSDKTAPESAASDSEESAVTAQDESPSEDLGPRHAAKKTRRRIWPRKRWVQVLVSVVLVLVLLIGGFGGYLYWQSTRIDHINVAGLSNQSHTGANKGTENILMVGSTSRCALTVQNPAYGLCSQGVTGVNSDVIMILHLNWNTSQVSVLSIPRDTFIPNARTTGAEKIDAALAEGPSQLVAAIQEDFGIPIQHYVELNFQTFAQVVDALGGVKMYFPMPVYDAYSNLKQLTTGCVQLNGVEALQVVRARHLQYQSSLSDGSNPAYWPQEALSDIARIRRDHEFLRVLGVAVAKQGLSDPIADTKIIDAVAPHLTVDSGFSASHMIDMILQFHSVNIGAAPQYTLPVMTSTSFSYVYEGSNYGNVTFPVNFPDITTIDQFLGVGIFANTMTGKTLPTTLQTTVSVLNGSGISGAAQSAARQLKALGFNIGTVGDTTPVGNPAQTVVAYNSLNPQVVAQAQIALRALAGQTIMAYEPTMTSPVTLVLGTAYAIAPPYIPPTTTKSTTTTSKTSSKSTTSTTTAPTTSTTAVPGFTPPNPAISKLQPWDPRSCTASGGEGP